MEGDLVVLAPLPPALLVSPPLPGLTVPALVAVLGDAAAWRYVEFLAVNIRNPNTRRAYARACGCFFG